MNADAERALELFKLRSNKHCPVYFLGAGASLHDGSGPSSRLPTGSELARMLADWSGMRSNHEPPPSLIEAASYFEIVGNRHALMQRLKNVFDDQHGPGEVHRYLAALSDIELIVTTNYDRFIERSFDAAERNYHLVINLLPRDSDGRGPVWVKAGSKDSVRLTSSDDLRGHPVIFKIHGSLGLDGQLDDSFVISEEDYYAMAGREHSRTLVPPQIASIVDSKDIAFLGYGLGDIHIRHAFLSGDRDRHGHVAVARSITEFQRKYWRLLGVDGIACDVQAFVRYMTS